MSTPLVLPSVTPKHLRKLIQSAIREIVVSWGSNAGTLAIKTVEAQLKAHEKRPARKVNITRDKEGRVPSLFDTSAKKLAASISELAGTEESINALVEMEGLSPNVLDHIALLADMPYHVFCKARDLSGAKDDGSAVDEWVLRNEIWLREGANAEEQESMSSKRVRTESKSPSKGSKGPDWTFGLVRLSAHADAVFPGSELTDTSRIITRPTSLTGFGILDGRRSAAIHLQPSMEAFSTRFKILTDGLLEGLDWDNVFVAGGIVLGTLLCTDDKESPNSPDQWKTSDVDLYIYGLGPVDSNKKMEHIFSVFKRNLPKNAPVLVVRNSKTITFFSQFPLRRIQVVLKLVEWPKDVLLNFDLDICAIGWDGKDVWMLPRAARALQTGYTVFTMDLINGHYLGDRRATQEDRVFKYADKGYGIRILSSYTTELRKIMEDPEKMRKIGQDHRYWGGYDEVTEPWDPQSFEKIVNDAREWTASKIPPAEGGVPTKVTHMCLQNKYQVTEDPQRRSVLSGLTLFMRHVALWEREVSGDVIIEKNSWAAPMYDNFYAIDFAVGYNDTPDYAWDAEFTTKGFIEKIFKFNRTECLVIDECLDKYSKNDSYSKLSSNMKLESNLMVPNLRAQRIIHATSVREILKPKCDIYLPVWLPENFIKFANQALPEAVQDSGVSDYRVKPLKHAIKARERANPEEHEEVEDIQLVIWRITNITMWQQLHRAVDEIHEMIWSFHQVYAAYRLEEDDRLRMLATLLARRAIRLTAQDEYAAFARWALRKPVPLSSDHDFIR